MGISLKPCPFCGNKAVFSVVETRSGGGQVSLVYTIRCNRCVIAQTQRAHTDIRLSEAGEIVLIDDQRDEVAELWNRRADENVGLYERSKQGGCPL